jgi:hypothetical protein
MTKREKKMVEAKSWAIAVVEAVESTIFLQKDSTIYGIRAEWIDFSCSWHQNKQNKKKNVGQLCEMLTMFTVTI